MGNRRNLVAGGTVIWLLAELMFSLACSRSSLPPAPPPSASGHPRGSLSTSPYGIGFTAVLLASSTMGHVGVNAGTRSDATAMRRCFLAAAALGVVVLAGLGNLYGVVVESGMHSGHLRVQWSVLHAHRVNVAWIAVFARHLPAPRNPRPIPPHPY